MAEEMSSDDVLEMIIIASIIPSSQNRIIACIRSEEPIQLLAMDLLKDAGHFGSNSRGCAYFVTPAFRPID